MVKLKGQDNLPNTDYSKTGPGTPKLLFDVHAAAERLSMSEVSIRKLLRQRRLRRIENFRKILIPASELERFSTVE